MLHLKELGTKMTWYEISYHPSISDNVFLVRNTVFENWLIISLRTFHFALCIVLSTVLCVFVTMDNISIVVFIIVIAIVVVVVITSYFSK